MSSSSSDDESNIAISRGSTSLSQTSLISSCRKLAAETPPVPSVTVGGSLTSLGNLHPTAQKQQARGKKRGGGGVAKSCRLLTDQPGVVSSAAADGGDGADENRASDSYAAQDKGSHSSHSKLNNSEAPAEQKKRETYRGVSYFLSTQDELGPDLSSEVAASSIPVSARRHSRATNVVSEKTVSTRTNAKSVDRVGSEDINKRKKNKKKKSDEGISIMDNSDRFRVTFANKSTSVMQHRDDEWDPMADLREDGDGGQDHHYKNQSVNQIRRKLSSEYDKLHREDKYMDLPASTHTLLHTEPIFSFPFLFSLGIAVLSALCLVLVLVSELKPGESGNWLDVPTGITTSVKVAQYCGILVGLLMEEEIPQGLILMRAISRQSFHATYPDLSYNRFILSCLLRLVMGYLFLMNLFVTIVQADDVITIFFDILALEFVQHLDDMAWELGRKDILGRNLNVATTVEYKVLTRVAYKRLLSEKQDEENALIERRKKSDEQQQQQTKESGEEWRFYCIRRRKKFGFRWILKATYFFNLAGLLIGTIIVGQRQGNLYYSCKSVTITFGDQVWENAYVTNRTNSSHVEERTLIYSYFNGAYEITGRDQLGYPIYTEMNKNTGEPYKETIGAQIVYCEEEEAWIFTHELISKQEVAFDDESGCPQWLLRSPKTKAYDLMDVPREDWSVWTGVITPGNKVSIVCNVCDRNSDCNYNGECIEYGQCRCNTGFFGLHCEFREACQTLIDDEGYLYTLATPPKSNDTIFSYNRPIYTSRTFTWNLTDLVYEDIENSTNSDSTIINSTNAPQLVTNATNNTCYPEVSKIKIESTTGEAISMIELQAQSSGGVNVALEGTASQSSDLKYGEVLNASRAIDGSYASYSSTNDTNATWELVLPQSFPIESVIVVNGYCGNNSDSDPLGCLCRLSNATILLIDEFDAVIANRSAGDTCNQDVVLEAFDAQYPCPDDNITTTAQAYNSTDNSTVFNQTGIVTDLSLYVLIALVYSGSRWFGTIEFGSEASFSLDPSLYSNEYHAFWDELYEQRTVFLSEPTSGSTPIGADFFENQFLQTSPWDDYGPYGLLTPVHNISGKGFFHCFGTNSTPVNVSTEIIIRE